MLIFFLEPGTLVIGAELFLFSLLAYYIRMVGHYRLRIAVGGMNFAVSAFSALFAYLLMSNSLPVTLSSEISALISAVAILISVFYLGAGILNTITQNSGE
jgi:hypothetical protein